jgi:hypothetical protein
MGCPEKRKKKEKKGKKKGKNIHLLFFLFPYQVQGCGHGRWVGGVSWPLLWVLQ